MGRGRPKVVDGGTESPTNGGGAMVKGFGLAGWGGRSGGREVQGMRGKRSRWGGRSGQRPCRVCLIMVAGGVSRLR